MVGGSDIRDIRVLVFAPVGRDAALIARTLGESGIAAEAANSAQGLLEAIREGAGAALVTEESLDHETIEAFAETLAAQPPWSDFPIIVLTSGGGSTELSELAAKAREPLGNVTLLERPVRTVTLLSAVRSALRARKRQYEIRDEWLRRFEAERALFESEQRYRSLVEATTNAVWITDSTGAITAEMPAWAQFTRQAVEQYTGCGWRDAIHPEDRERVLDEFRRAPDEKPVANLEFRLRRHDGEYRRVRARMVAVRDENGGIREWVGACTDIETQKAAEEALMKSEKLAIAGRLAASIAHEINNPLEAVTNLLFLILGSSSLEEAKGFAQAAEAELARVSQIATQTLKFYRQPTIATACDVPELVDSVIALFQRKLASSEIQVEREYQSTAALMCYSGEMRQVFANILANAIEAMRAGGRLRIRIRNARDWKHGDTRGIRVTVLDTGPGIAHEFRAHIFEPFFTTKNGTGTGLGLWIARELVHKQGGKMRLYSSTRSGRSGCAVSFFFPCTDVIAERATDRQTYAEPRAVSSENGQVTDPVKQAS